MVVFFHVFIQASSHIQRVFKGLFHRNIEPELNAGGNEVHGEKEKYDRGQKSDGYERKHKPGAELRTHDLSLSVVKKLCQVPEHKKYQQYDQQHIDVDEDEHQNGVGDGEVRAKMDDPVFGKGQKGDQGDDNGDDDDLSFAPFLIVHR